MDFFEEDQTATDRKHIATVGNKNYSCRLMTRHSGTNWVLGTYPIILSVVDGHPLYFTDIATSSGSHAVNRRHSIMIGILACYS
jgi:hypothetical protein